MLQDFADEYERYKLIGQKALAQIPDEGLNQLLGAETNSAAMLVRHISGNFCSRFTDFLTSDGEKPWRNREAEFEQREYSRQEVEELWAKGWAALESQLAQLSDADLQKEARIRGQALTVHEALARSIAHLAYHIGQIVLLARLLATSQWQWISIPKGQSQQYNLRPMLEKKPQ
jgi:uncharacterized damage-inducible protein DinB